MKKGLKELATTITDAVVAATEQTKAQHLKDLRNLFDEKDGVYEPRYLTVSLPGPDGAESATVQVPLMSLIPMKSVQLDRILLDIEAEVDADGDETGELVLNMGGRTPAEAGTSSSVKLKLELAAATPPEALIRLNGKLVQGTL